MKARLAYVNMAGRLIGSLTQDKPIQGGYLGTSLTASICPDAHLRWTKEQAMKIGKALARAPPAPSHQTTPPPLRSALQNSAYTLPHGDISQRHEGGRLSPRKKYLERSGVCLHPSRQRDSTPQ
jgi:hypothetical protein